VCSTARVVISQGRSNRDALIYFGEFQNFRLLDFFRNHSRYFILVWRKWSFSLHFIFRKPVGLAKRGINPYPDFLLSEHNVVRWGVAIVRIVKSPKNLTDITVGCGNKLRGSEFTALNPHVRSLIIAESTPSIAIGRFGSASTAIGSINSSLRLMSRSDLFPPLPDSHISIENDREEGEPLNKKPYPVASLCACMAGMALGFGAFWLMRYDDHFWFGLFLLLVSPCVFIYGLNGIFDVLEINTQKSQRLARFFAQFLGEYNELTSDEIHRHPL